MRNESVRKRDAVAVGQLPQLVLVRHRPGGCARSEEAAPEARTLLVGPVDEAKRDRRRALGGDAPENFDTGDHVQRSVQPTPVRNRVDVSADEYRTFGVAGEREPLIARGVDRTPSPRLGDEAAEPLARLLPRLRPGDALRAVLVSRQLPELLQLGDGASSDRAAHGASSNRRGALECGGMRAGGPTASTGRGSSRAPAAAARSCGLRRSCSSALWPLWEGYRWLWETTGLDGAVPGERPDDAAPARHLGALFEPPPRTARARRDALHAALFTAKEAAVGFVIGATVGFVLGVVIAHSGLLQRGCHALHRRVADDPDPRASRRWSSSGWS